MSSSSSQSTSEDKKAERMKKLRELHMKRVCILFIFILK
jgi:hypothetical protein